MSDLFFSSFKLIITNHMISNFLNDIHDKSFFSLTELVMKILNSLHNGSATGFEGKLILYHL